MEGQNNNSCGAGKGDKPRNCFSKKYRDNYDSINWTRNQQLSKNEKEYIQKIKKTVFYPQFLLILVLMTSCSHLDKIKLRGEVTGTRYSNQQFVKGKHIISATYPVSETVNVKGQVAQPYISNHSVDVGMPDYGETSLEILF